MKKAIIITENKYPSGDAGAVRQHSFAKMFESIGFNVIVVGYGEATNGKFCEYDGIKYISFRAKSKKNFVRLINRVLFGLHTIAFLHRNAVDADVIMVVDTLPYAFKLIKRFADARGITLIHDSVEWYSEEEFPNGSNNIQYKLKEKTNTSIIGKGWRVVAISQCLYEHFSRTSDKVIRIPVVMDIANIEYSKSTNNTKVKFVYAGSPGLKDNLKEIVEGFSLLSKKQLQQVELHIVGISKHQLVDMCGIDVKMMEMLDDSLIVYGRLTRDETLQKIRDADYSVLLRQAQLRYAKAGFPTKIVESLACGTPPMCNISSDLSDYLQDGENAVIIEGQTPQDVKDAIIKALLYKEKDIDLRTVARKTAENYFDYNQYIDVFKDLLV